MFSGSIVCLFPRDLCDSLIDRATCNRDARSFRLVFSISVIALCHATKPIDFSLCVKATTLTINLLLFFSSVEDFSERNTAWRKVVQHLELSQRATNPLFLLLFLSLSPLRAEFFLSIYRSDRSSDERVASSQHRIVSSIYTYVRSSLQRRLTRSQWLVVQQRGERETLSIC